MSTPLQRMTAGELYDPGDPAIQAALVATRAWLVRYNASLGATTAERRALLRERLASVGDGSSIRPPFHCDYGFNLSLGTGVFLNFNCIALDVCPIVVGDRTQIGPGVQLLAADHPRDAATRDAGLEFGRPVIIGRTVWIGAGAIVLPGVTSGDDAIIGAGAIVNRDVTAGMTVAGNPARPIRTASSQERIVDSAPPGASPSEEKP